MAKRALTRKEEQEVFSRVRSWEGGNDLFPNGYAVAARGRKRKERQPAPPPRRLVASRSSEDGGRVAAYIAGDDVSFEDIISYAKYTPEFSQEFKDGNRRFQDIQSPGDFIWWVFNKSTSFKKDRDSFQCPAECHISEMSYADNWSLLKVKFYDSTEIVYSRVPSQVFEIMRTHAKDGSKGWGVDRKLHTQVGIDFWNYVRIRGTRHGVQYPAYYLSGAPSANKGVGGKVEAEAGRARVGTQRTGEDGLPVDSAEKAKARKAAPQKALAFLDKELTAKDIDDIRKFTLSTQNVEGTVAHALINGDVKKAKELGEELMKIVKTSPTLSKSVRDHLLGTVKDPKFSEPYMPLLGMERAMYIRKLWPPIKN